MRSWWHAPAYWGIFVLFVTPMFSVFAGWIMLMLWLPGFIYQHYDHGFPGTVATCATMGLGLALTFPLMALIVWTWRRVILLLTRGPRVHS